MTSDAWVERMNDCIIKVAGLELAKDGSEDEDSEDEDDERR